MPGKSLRPPRLTPLSKDVVKLGLLYADKTIPNFDKITNEQLTLISQQQLRSVTLVTNSTYLKDPTKTTRIPTPFTIPTLSPKYRVPKTTRRTCFTLAAIHNVSGEVSLFATKLDTLSVKAKKPENNKTRGMPE